MNTEPATSHPPITPGNPVITLDVRNHGQYRVSCWALDYAINHYLLTSMKALRTILNEREPDIDWSDVHSPSHALIILADWDCNVDSSPYRIY